MSLVLVFECPIKDKEKLKAILEQEPYAVLSFSRNGYKLKDGAAVGQDPEKCYLFIKATEEFAKFAREKLKEIAIESSQGVAAAVSRIIEEEENSAEIGFGSIFGE
ncbi:MAG: hypothetical protein QXN37_00710 [Candidatus Anstonellaceae archaeon]